MKPRMLALQAEWDALARDSGAPDTQTLDVLTHPSLPDLYRRKVGELETVLDGPDREEAMEVIRSMVERVDLAPRAGATGLDAVLHGDLAAILSACAVAQTKNAPGGKATGRQLSLVAGTRNDFYRTTLSGLTSLRPIDCRRIESETLSMLAKVNE